MAKFKNRLKIKLRLNFDEKEKGIFLSSENGGILLKHCALQYEVK